MKEHIRLMVTLLLPVFMLLTLGGEAQSQGNVEKLRMSNEDDSESMRYNIEERARILDAQNNVSEGVVNATFNQMGEHKVYVVLFTPLGKEITSLLTVNDGRISVDLDKSQIMPGVYKITASTDDALYSKLLVVN